MKSKIAEAIGLKTKPVAILLSNAKPEDAMQFKEGRWGCVAAMFTAAAMKGKSAVFDRKTYGCPGGGVGLGFGNLYLDFPGGFDYFLSIGNPEFCNTELGKNIVRIMQSLKDGEAYKKTPELVKSFVDWLPITEVPAEYVIFKPLSEVKEDETPEVVTFLVTADQLSAMVVLANYDRKGSENVMIPFAAGCHNFFLVPYNEGKSDLPRAVVGMTDISVRKHMPKDMLSFAMPYKRFLEMEDNVEGSFLQRHCWLEVLPRNNSGDEK
ncbi:protein of unknown function DUF169 [Desulfofarcimen acetoxidans DSM 771]|uniref:DUF169 domain-containing protein n=1 Tax=Desulfofarcimen acetoxidans (strain ATCC 49208 / DSM 771 / KCTC 5769 / VKM B-1644 / 5575) TaxID=485916 RepID=C8W2S3_DESAS|nr:DUF169 domain-containing protein [Desulfofarcimen acetoxidans]ACV61079.1 protein of unknown function DUF169 [Desulfofarcimen acetoxidans DSM 771]